jgi:hypothetical protein
VTGSQSQETVMAEVFNQLTRQMDHSLNQTALSGRTGGEASIVRCSDFKAKIACGYLFVDIGIWTAGGYWPFISQRD